MPLIGACCELNWCEPVEARVWSVGTVVDPPFFDNLACLAEVYRWKQLYGGLMPSEVKKLRQLEEENMRLRRVVADLHARQGDAAGGDPPQTMTPARGTRDDRLRACCVPGF